MGKKIRNLIICHQRVMGVTNRLVKISWGKTLNISVWRLHYQDRYVVCWMLEKFNEVSLASLKIGIAICVR